MAVGMNDNCLKKGEEVYCPTCGKLTKIAYHFSDGKNAMLECEHEVPIMKVKAKTLVMALARAAGGTVADD